MQVIVVTGMPATGKSTLAKKLADSLGYRLIGKDEIKEALFTDAVHRATFFRNWRQFESASLEALYVQVDQVISKKQSIIIESNFHPPELRRLEIILKTVPAKQVVCHAGGWTAFRRFRQRRRHSGHGRRVWYPGFVLFALFPFLSRRAYPPAPFIDKTHTLVVDTSDFKTVDYESILEFLKAR